MNAILPLFLIIVQITNAIDPGVPPQISFSLREIRQRHDFAEECVYYNPDLEDKFSNLEKRFFSAADDAFGTWGGDPDFPYTQFAWDLPARCRQQDESRALTELEQALDAFSHLYRTLTLTMDQSGLWVGPLKVCRDHVVRTSFEWGEFTGPALEVNLTKEAGSYWAEITGRSINKQLYVRVDGRVSSKPMVYDRHEKNNFWITGLDRTAFARAAALAAAPC